MDSPATVAASSAIGAKRKRTPEVMDEGRSGPHGSNVPVAQINYLVKSKPDRLRLIEGDSESFGNILSLIDDYEGVLQRHESLSSNLGAKLVGPLLLKSFERLFDGPIKISQPSFPLDEAPITWLDIVTFARTNPSDFYLSEYTNIPGEKLCRFWIRGVQIEISEDDYTLIMSGAPERMIPTQPLPEDESAELATMNIVEGRLAMLIKKADAVASKARQLNYHLRGRKAAIRSRKIAEPGVPETTQPFSAINARSQAPPNGETGNDKLQQQLLEQFLFFDRRQSLPASALHSKSKGSRLSTADQTAIFVNSYNGDSDRRMSLQPTTSDDGLEGQNKLLMASRIEKLARGDTINPPCDRCRRLKFDCTKHLTACQACTRKHAKCSWKDIREGELDNPIVTEPAPSQVVASVATAESENVNGNAAFVVTEPANAIHFEMGMREKERQKDMAEEAAMLTHIAAAASR